MPFNKRFYMAHLDSFLAIEQYNVCQYELFMDGIELNRITTNHSLYYNNDNN